jgi:hypothetical protein
MAENRKASELKDFVSNATTFLSSIFKVEVIIVSDEEKNPLKNESNEKHPLRHVPSGFLRQMTKNRSGPPPKEHNNVARFTAPSNSSKVERESTAQLQRTRSSQQPAKVQTDDSSRPAQLRRTRSSPPTAQAPRAHSSQQPAQVQGVDSSRPAKRRKNDHTPIDQEHASLIRQNADRARQLSLGKQDIRDYVEGFFYQPKKDVCTNPTADEIYRKGTEEFFKEENRMKRLEKDNPGVSREILYKVYPPPTIDSENLTKDNKRRTEMLEEIAKRKHLPRGESVQEYVKKNWNNLDERLGNFIGLYGKNAPDATRGGGRRR